MPSQTGVECFLSLAETLSFTETARQLYITQQAVSRHIAKLEEELGFALFKRTRHYVNLTKAGENFYRLFIGFRTDYEAALEETRQFYDSLGSRLHIAFLDWIDITYFVNKAVDLLSQNVHDLKFTAERQRQSALNMLVFQEKASGVITYDSFLAPTRELGRETIFETEYVLLCRSDLVSPGDTERLRTLPYVKPQEVDESEGEIVKKAQKDCQEFDLEPDDVFITPNVETAYTLVEMGKGVLLTTSLSMMAANPRFAAFPTTKKERLVCAWHTQNESRLLPFFIECLKTAFSET